MNLLQKFLPLDKILALAMRFGLLKAPLKIAAEWWGKAQGGRTQGSLVLAALIGAAASLGWLPWETAKPIIEMLVGVAGAAALDKVNRILPVVESTSAKIAEEAAKKDA